MKKLALLAVLLTGCAQGPNVEIPQSERFQVTRHANNKEYGNIYVLKDTETGSEYIIMRGAGTFTEIKTAGKK